MNPLLFAAGILAVAARASCASKPFENFVTFGDSYTVSRCFDNNVACLGDDSYMSLLLASSRQWHRVCYVRYATFFFDG